MSDDVFDFPQLMERYRSGDKSAAEELFKRYGHHILHVVRARLIKKLRSKYDSIDFTQAVWASFFMTTPAQLDFETPEKLINYLTTLARNKVIMEIRTRLRAKRDIYRENSLDGSAVVTNEDLIDPNPSPSQVLMADEKKQGILELAGPLSLHSRSPRGRQVA